MYSFDLAELVSNILIMRSKMNGNLPADVRNSSDQGMKKAEDFGKETSYSVPDPMEGIDYGQKESKPALKISNNDSIEKEITIHSYNGNVSENHFFGKGRSECQ